MTIAAQLLVVSPDRTVQQAAQHCAAGLGHTAFIARALAQARRVLERVRIDLVCLDSILPGDETERFCRELSIERAGPAPAVLFLVPPAFKLVPAALPSFVQRKRWGLVFKPLEHEAFSREMARLLAGRPPRERGTDLVRVGPFVLDGATRRLLFAGGGALLLTPTEFRLLRCLMGRPGEFVSPEELLEEAWGYPPGSSGPEVVRAHVSNVRRKLRSSGQDPQVLRTMPYQGYSFTGGARAV